MVTVWLPLRPVLSPDEGGTSLLFAEKSHRDLGRLWYDHDSEGRYDEVHHGALAAGDATWHHGWILHSAAPNDTDQDREALAVTYIADGARALTPEAWGEVEDYSHTERGSMRSTRVRPSTMPSFLSCSTSMSKLK